MILLLCHAAFIVQFMVLTVYIDILYIFKEKWGDNNNDHIYLHTIVYNLMGIPNVLSNKTTHEFLQHLTFAI